MNRPILATRIARVLDRHHQTSVSITSRANLIFYDSRHKPTRMSTMTRKPS